MVSKKIISSMIIILCASTACTKDNYSICGDKEVNIVLKSCEKDLQTKTVYNSVTSKSDWNNEERMGIAYYFNGLNDGRAMSPFLKIGTISEHSASFTGKLIDNGAGSYEIVGVYPYHRETLIDDIHYQLPSTQYPSQVNWDSSCDVLIAKSPSTVLSSIADFSSALSFKHVLGWAVIDFADYFEVEDDYSDELVTAVSVTADLPIAGDFIVNLKAQTIDKTPATQTTVMVRYPSASVKAKDVKAFFTLLPGNYGGATVKLYTEQHIFTFNRGSFTISEASLLNISVSQQNGDTVGSVTPSFPEKPTGTDSLSIMLLGHSYGVNSVLYLPRLLRGAGINDVFVSRFHKSNCSLQTHYKNLINDIAYDSYTYADCHAVSYAHETSNTIDSELRGHAYDIVVLQTSLENAGRYDTYQPELNLLVDKINDICMDAHGKKPLIAWQMFWPISVLAEAGGNQLLTYRMSYYNNSSTQMFYDYRMATREMIDDTGISLIIPSGTAIENMRHSPLNIPEENEFTADMYHLSTKGCYVAACTWFEALIKPIYGVSVLGNSYTGLFNSDDALDAQQAAINAVNDMFNVTYTE